MNDPKFPAGWDGARVQQLIDHYEGMSEDEIAAEDDAMAEDRDGHALVTVPYELLPAIRQLLASHKIAPAS